MPKKRQTYRAFEATHQAPKRYPQRPAQPAVNPGDVTVGAKVELPRVPVDDLAEGLEELAAGSLSRTFEEARR